MVPGRNFQKTMNQQPPQTEDYDLQRMLKEARVVVERIHDQSQHLHSLVDTLVGLFDRDDCVAMAEQLHKIVQEVKDSSDEMHNKEA